MLKNTALYENIAWDYFLTHSYFFATNEINESEVLEMYRI